MSAPPARGQPAMKARRLGSRDVSFHPGKASNDQGRYCARSAAGFGGGHAGQGSWRAMGAQAAASAARKQATMRPMWVVYLEMTLALVVAGLIVWFTWPKKKK